MNNRVCIFVQDVDSRAGAVQRRGSAAVVYGHEEAEELSAGYVSR